MAVTSKPDLDDYLDRITAIEETILSGSIAVKNPSDISPDPPYWLHLANAVTIQKASSLQWYLTFNLRVLLVRENGINAWGDWAFETQIVDDMCDIVWYFMAIEDYRNLRGVGSYTTVQPGFDLDSVQISNMARWSGRTNAGDCTGTIFTLSFSHRMYNTPAG